MTFSHAEIAQSRCVLATLKRDELVFCTARFYFLTPHLSVWTPHFGWSSRLNYTMNNWSLYITASQRPHTWWAKNVSLLIFTIALHVYTVGNLQPEDI